MHTQKVVYDVQDQFAPITSAHQLCQQQNHNSPHLLRLVVLVVHEVHVLVQELVRVQSAMHPINADLNECQVHGEEREVRRPAHQRD